MKKLFYVFLGLILLPFSIKFKQCNMWICWYKKNKCDICNRTVKGV